MKWRYTFWFAAIVLNLFLSCQCVTVDSRPYTFRREAALSVPLDEAVLLRVLNSNTAAPSPWSRSPKSALVRFDGKLFCSVSVEREPLRLWLSVSVAKINFNPESVEKAKLVIERIENQLKAEIPQISSATFIETVSWPKFPAERNRSR